MKLNFVKISPTQNMTILINDKLDRGLHISLSDKLMAYENLFAEQVGFIEEPEDKKAVARLQMMGGEFCGNATMSLASYLVWKENLPVGSVKNVLLEVSGADELLDCVVTVRENGLTGKVKMPSAQEVEDISVEFSGKTILAHKVTLPGINHYIVKDSEIDINKTKDVNSLLDYLTSIDNAEALGIMFIDEDKTFITPLVYVKPTDSKIWEHGCGSGSASVGAFYAFKEGTEKVIGVNQPGGTIEVTAKPNGEIWIEGSVKIVADGNVYID